jgi:uncharacterized protein YndB with AHSA1/START domain
VTEESGKTLRIERTFDAPAEDVFDAWTSEEVLKRWLHGQTHLETPVAEVDLRVGGALRIVMRNPETGSELGSAHGEYTVVDPPNKLAFTWVWDHEQENPQMIELEFSEQGGKTTVVMINSGIPTEEDRGSNDRGWNVCFDNLEMVLAG